MSVRKDIVKIPIQANAYFFVYHKNLDIGYGPTLLLVINDKEILKFDCFGNKLGHYHFMNGKRIFFKESTVDEQIDKSIQEIVKNIDKYNFNKTKLLLKLIEVKTLLIEYENKFYKHLRNNIN